MGSFRFLAQSIYAFVPMIFIMGFTVFAKAAHKEANNNFGPPINVTKQLFFPDFSSNNPMIINHDLKLLGSAIVSYQKGSLQIPDNVDLSRHAAGRVLYSSPIRLFDPLSQTPASFHTTFSFQFEAAPRPQASDSNNGTSDFDNHGGHGLTFIIVPDEFTVGRSGPWLGMLNDACDGDYKAVGIEFDTRHNPEFGDPNDNHVGVNLGSIVSTATFNASDVGVYLNDGSVHRAWITYDGLRRHMELRLGSDGNGYPFRPAFSCQVDLSPFLKEYMFVGFSASTGNHTQIHNVLSWNFTSNSQSFLRIPSGETCESEIVVEKSGDEETSRAETPSGLLIFIAVVVLLLVALLNLYYSGKQRDQKSDVVLVLTDKMYWPRPPNKPRRFTLGEISSATRCFSEFQNLGSDMRGITYKAVLLNGCSMAVKRFSTQFFNSHGLNRRRVNKGIKAISRIRHPNLVPIRGWCFDNQETIVVYDYLPNGNLSKWLFGVGVLPWTRRFKALKDVAEALSYLHSKQLAHKNIKTTSVFLDLSFRGVLGDFGYVMCSTESKRFELAVSLTADVFEFGVFVLEVVAGRIRRSNSNIDPNGGGSDLLDLAWALHERNEKAKLVDRRMGSLLNLEQAVRVLDIGLLCTLNENKGRPTMQQVVEFLSLDGQLPELPPSRPVALFPYNSSTGLCSGYSCPSFK